MWRQVTYGLEHQYYSRFCTLPNLHDIKALRWLPFIVLLLEIKKFHPAAGTWDVKMFIWIARVDLGPAAVAKMLSTFRAGHLNMCPTR